MSDFEKSINASDLIDWIMCVFPDWCVGDVREIVDHIEEMPSAQPVIRGVIDESGRIEFIEQPEPKKGKWIVHSEVKNVYGGTYIECSHCGEKYVVQHMEDEKYCRNCGAKMEEYDE